MTGFKELRPGVYEPMDYAPPKGAEKVDRKSLHEIIDRMLDHPSPCHEDAAHPEEELTR